MKKTKEITGLPVIAIEGGCQLGTVYSLLINPETKKVDYLVLDRGKWYQEMRVLNYEEVIGIGEFAVTTKDSSKAVPVSSSERAIDLMEKDIRVLGTRVMTDKGKVIGTVTEYYIDEETGNIKGCQVSPDGKEEGSIIQGKNVITYSKDIIIVTGEAADNTLREPSPEETPAEQKPALSEEAVRPPEETGEERKKPIKVFEEHQRKYLLGRKVGKDIVDDNGNLLAREGEQITEELVEKVSEAGKYIELTMNAK